MSFLTKMHLAVERRLAAAEVPYAELDAEAAALPIGAEGVIALDHFQVASLFKTVARD